MINEQTNTRTATVTYSRRQGVGFIAYARSCVKKMQDEGRYDAAHKLDSYIGRFTAYLGRNEIAFKDFDSRLIRNYHRWLQDKALGRNSISLYIRNLKRVYRMAVDDGTAKDNHPFEGVDVSYHVKKEKNGLTLDEVRRLKELDLDGRSKAVNFARDMFLFSFYTRGMSFVDMAYLKKKDLHNGILTYRRKKTGQQLSIKWEQCMQEIIEKYPPNPTEYLLPIITSTDEDERLQYRNSLTLVNRKLKILSVFVRSPHPLSMYVARHSWASIAKSKNIPLSIISEGMGHDSETTTQIYLASLDTTIIDRANYLILNDL